MSREAKKEFHKRLAKKLSDLRKEYDDLREADRALGWVELDKPRFWGYQKTLRVRDDLLKGKQAHHLQQLCDLIQLPVKSRTKDFTVKEKNKGKITTKILKAVPKTFSDHDFEKKVPSKFKDEFERVVKTVTSWRGTYAQYRWRLVKAWRFKEKISKYYITKVRLFDSEIRSRMQEIENYIERNDLYAKFWRINNCRNSGWDKADREYQYLKEQRRALKDVEEAVIEYSLDKYQ
jgi:hypothetical protein